MRLLVCLLLFLPCGAQETECSIEGQVFNLATGEPVRKAQVILRAVGGNQEQVQGALSDSGGRFAIRGVKPGRYVMAAERSGFLSVVYGARRPGRPGATLLLTAGQQLKDVVFRLTPHGVITGRVLDEDGETVSGARVQAMRHQYVRGVRTLTQATGALTNDIGEYRIAGLAPGRYYLSATWERRSLFGRAAVQEDYAPTYYPGTADPAAAVPLQVIPGQQFRGIDVSLTRIRTVRVVGRVADPAGGALPRHVMVSLAQGDTGLAGRNTSAAQDGTFEIRGVTPGSYILAAHAYENDRRYTGSQRINVGDSGLDEINLAITPGFDVPGRVRVEGAAEPKLGDATVTLVPAGDLAFAGSTGGRIRDDGSFVLNSVTPDQCRVRVFGLPGNYYVKAARLGEADMLDKGAALAPGAGPLEVLLAAGGEVEGVVIDATQQATSGVTVVLAPADGRNRSDLLNVATTDGDGRFHLRGIAPGDYRLFAWEEVEGGAWEDPAFLRRFENAAEKVTIRENGRETVQLKPLFGEQP